MLKLTLPETDNFYREFTAHPNVVKVVALSGGYSREEANGRLNRNNGVIASFNRALTEGLNVKLSDIEFNSLLQASVENIYSASIT
jgi:fructose-bisphosphate aldolase class I